MDPRIEANKLAARPYTILTVTDLSTDGNPVYLASSPELEGCIGQGMTEKDALEDLAAARVDFIHSLLEDGLPVPSPQSYVTTTTAGQTANFTNIRVLYNLETKLDPIKTDPNSSKVTRWIGSLDSR